MKLFVFATMAAVGSLSVGSAASATVASVAFGSPLAVSCYRAAEERLASDQNIKTCTLALHGDTVTFDDLVATYVNRGILYLLKDQNGRANFDFETAIKLRSDMAEAWLNKGVVHLNDNQSAEALKCAQKALDLQVQNEALAYFVRGLAQEDAGHLEAAYSDLRKAQQLAPDWGEPARELTRYKVVRPS